MAEHKLIDMVFWITERHAIKERRAAGVKAPWTADPIMQSVRFCNVHREDDKVTKWIRENWNFGGDPMWKFVLARMVNWPSSLGQIDQDDTLEGQIETLKRVRAAGEKVFTSAYTISTCGHRLDKLDYVRGVVRTVCDEGGRIEPGMTCEEVWRGFMLFDGLGSFLSAQIVADMKNTKGHPLADASDWWTFSAPGPGSLRGLNWYFGHMPESGPITARTYAVWLAECRAEVDPLVADQVPRISDQDFQNCLCEFSKYCKVKYTTNAHVRNKYVAHD